MKWNIYINEIRKDRGRTGRIIRLARKMGADNYIAWIIRMRKELAKRGYISCLFILFLIGCTSEPKLATMATEVKDTTSVPQRWDKQTAPFQKFGIIHTASEPQSDIIPDSVSDMIWILAVALIFAKLVYKQSN